MKNCYPELGRHRFFYQLIRRYQQSLLVRIAPCTTNHIDHKVNGEAVVTVKVCLYPCISYSQFRSNSVAQTFHQRRVLYCRSICKGTCNFVVLSLGRAMNGVKGSLLLLVNHE